MRAIHNNLKTITMSKFLWIISAAVSCCSLLSCNSNNPSETSAKAGTAGLDKNRTVSMQSLKSKLLLVTLSPWLPIIGRTPSCYLTTVTW